VSLPCSRQSVITVFALPLPDASAAGALATARASTHAPTAIAAITRILLLIVLKLMEQANEPAAQQFRCTPRVLAHALGNARRIKDAV